MNLCSGSAAQSSSISKPSDVVYYNQDGVKAPGLVSADFSPVIPNKCKYEGAGIVRVFMVVNAQGKPDKVTPLYPFDDDIDKAAIGIATVDRFSPGTKDGVSVAVAQELEIKLTVCRANVADKDGRTSERLRLKSVPVQRLFPATEEPLPVLSPVHPAPTIAELAKQHGKLDPDQSHPVPLETPEAEWPPALQGIEGVSLVNLVIDAKGNPQAMRVVSGTNEAFNEKALEAVAKYRFKPAMKGNDPIPSRMSIEVNFRAH
jgi:TonB family protein